ncbi:hypothetical protein GCM10023321_20680 [Pseudonocardia eucalypti]|uniref:NTP pyrophosphohydrolase n=1 Tax=Pseudonocardia eucalypti TaxID=648755 RepID=A0ABP9PU82_9PSEU
MAHVTLVIDAANVVGSRPDGWWRDRPGAAARLLSQVATALRAGALDAPVVVVLEGAARAGAPAGPGEVAGLTVTHAERDGDSAILSEAEALVRAGTGAEVVTADRGLRERVTLAGATVLPPRWLLDRL